MNSFQPCKDSNLFVFSFISMYGECNNNILTKWFSVTVRGEKRQLVLAVV